MIGIRGGGLLVALMATWFTAGASAHAACLGSCDGTNTIGVQDIKTAVTLALGTGDLVDCATLVGGDQAITVDDLVVAVNSLLGNCVASTPTPTATTTPTPEQTSEATPTATGPAGPIIFTVAGEGTAGYNGEAIDPLQADLYLPQDVTMGPDGLLYVVDWNNHRIRRIRDGVIETIAGTGDLGDAQNGQALYVNFNHPTNVLFDKDGTMLIAAWHNSLIKRLDLTTGQTVTIAGTGARAYGGDEGPALQAALDLPSSTAIDSNDNIYISDQANYRIRQVEPNGTIHTVVGKGTAGYSGDGGRAEDAELNSPKGQAAPPAGRICIDSRNRIYIADSGNHAVRMVDTDGTIDTIAGNGTPGYGGDEGPAKQALLDTPSDVAIGPDGSIYIADTMNSVVRVITPDGMIHTLAGTGERGFSGDGGPARQAKLDRPYGVDVASNGDIYVADTHNQRIRKIVQGDVFVPPTPLPTPTPQIVPCTDEVGSICTYLGTGGTGFNGDGFDRVHTALYWPFDIEFMKVSGRRIFLDWNNHKVREILPDDTVVTIMGTDFVGDGPDDLSDTKKPGADPLTVNLNHPTDLQELPNGDVVVMSWHNHKIRTIDHETGRVLVMVGRGAGYAGDGMPVGVDQPDGTIVNKALINQPPHGVLDRNGNLFFIDQRNQRIRVLRNFANDREQAVIDTVVGVGPPPGFNGDGLAKGDNAVKLSFPTGANPEPSGGLALDALGRLYFSDTNNHRIRRVDFFDSNFSNGSVTTIAGTGVAGFGGDDGPAPEAQINYPEDMEIGPDNNLYFADTNNHRVRVIYLDQADPKFGTITTVAGTGEKGYSGDGGPALQAQLNRPFGIAFDANGDLFISDTFNSRIRKVKR